MALMARSKAKHRGPAKHKPKLKVKGAGAAKRKAQRQRRGGDAMDAEPTRPGQHDAWCLFGCSVYCMEQL
jgi:hypothetical protein